MQLQCVVAVPGLLLMLLSFFKLLLLLLFAVAVAVSCAVCCVPGLCGPAGCVQCLCGRHTSVF